MEYTQEVLFVLAALISVAGSQAAEMFLTPLLEKYSISDTELRKGIFIFATTVFNLIFMYVLKIDVFAGVLDQNISAVTLLLGAFTGSGVGQYYHGLKGLVGPRKNIIELGRDVLDAAEKVSAEK